MVIGPVLEEHGHVRIHVHARDIMIISPSPFSWRLKVRNAECKGGEEEIGVSGVGDTGEDCAVRKEWSSGDEGCGEN